MSTLTIGEVYQAKVLDVKENYDTFSGTNGMMHCHGFQLDIAGEIYQSQICTENPKQEFALTGDKVMVKISKLNKSTYTLSSMKLDTSEPMPGVIKTPPVPVPPGKNILMRGSAAEIALQQSVAFHTRVSHMPNADLVEDDEVLGTADKFMQWLIDKNSQF